MDPKAYCFHKTFEPAGPSEFRMDRHYLLYAMQGTLRLEAQGQRWTLPPARAALISAGHPITISILSRLTSASVLFAIDFMPAPPDVLSVFDVSPLARELIGECQTWGADNGPLTPYSRSIFQSLSAVVTRLAQTPSPCVLPVPTSPALARALALTEEQATSTPNFNDIARKTGQSPRTLARRFSDEMGMTWRDALRRIRMIRAIEALAISDAPITQIALDVGYNSLSAFNVAFRDMTGKSPTQYRATFQS